MFRGTTSHRTAPYPTWVLSLVLATLACSGSGDADDDGSAAVEHGRAQPWVVGKWFAPEYEGAGHTPPMGLIVSANGTWTHSTSGVEDGSGAWHLEGDRLFMGSQSIDEVLPNCRSLKFMGSWEYVEYHRDDFPSTCPHQPPPLDRGERCLLGEFEEITSSNVNSQLVNTVRTADRTSVTSASYESSVSGPTYFTHVCYWRIEDGKSVTLDVSGNEDSSGARFDQAAIDHLEATRKTPPDPECELSALLADPAMSCDETVCPVGEATDCGSASCVSPVSSETNNQACNDGMDNDANGRTDCDDFHCSANPLVTICGTETTDDVCSDGLDNDGNGFSDCSDYNCLISPSVAHCPAEKNQASCSNGIDDDGDGKIDCGDPSCSGSAFVSCG